MEQTAHPDSIEETATFSPRFDEHGLVPAIVVDGASGSVVMMAWMNAEALQKTLETGFAHYWSRSRRTLWKKGETSGALQEVLELRTDCDQDTLVLTVRIARPEDTCHTGRPSCFYRKVPLGAGPLSRDLVFDT
ncbi:phosphoribosyl-AMP cyclohydrolase [Propylenella binzhouense]|uniref:Phosphoribosyl-AMP cyclohydrolase n=1 Tax=Propylenella binzhouense TaxID=2555902 RepID=A0A964WTB8_9HYPH|nr:phosphoribosyl-AMP cyclohydrolase [Propylenella binzhouense]MYZ47838.1 phosphoribosyl-AMP cyclohydrolase [Propylenella binzhouense]